MKVLRLFLFVSLLFFPTLSQADWPTVAANPQRTSWTLEEVRGSVTADWYRVIEPFIPHKIQVIGAEGKVFLSTARGLYAFNAADGSLLWTYATELPLGHSPTYSNGTLYVGGYDRRIHAVNASNGLQKTGWTFVEAGAGFETNPLVVNNRVYAGNRDGYFYCLDVNTGALIWRWRDEVDEYPDAPIRYSAAYKDGVIYFAADNSHAYALSENGSLVWKSAKLPGVGFSTYWPVVYTDRSTGKDWVLFSGTKKEVGWVWFGDSYFEENYDIMSTNQIPVGGFIGPTGNQPGDWVAGTQTIDASRIQSYLNSHPHKRHLFVLDAATGSEHPVFAPVTWVSATHGGGKQPPVIGSDGVIYTHMGYRNGNPGESPNAGASGCIAGWKFGTQYISRVCDFTRGFADEPVSFTAGGNLIHWSEGFNMTYGAFEINKPYGSNATWEYPAAGGWSEGQQIAPGTHEMYEPCKVFGSCNGVYQAGDYGFYPYQGRLYMIDNNTLVALKPSGAGRKLPKVTIASPSGASGSPLSASTLSQRLAAEVSKMIAAGHLRPGFHDTGLWGQSATGSYFPLVEGDHLSEYFHNPADTVTTLLLTLPYLSPSLQTQVRNYVKNNYGPGAPYSITSIAHVGWKNGALREVFDDTPERASLISRNTDDPNAIIATVPRTYSQWNGNISFWNFPPASFYAAWKYALVFPGEAATIFDAMKNKLAPPVSDANLLKYPYILNQFIAGYKGYVELGRLVGANVSSQEGTLTQLTNLRVSNFSKDTYVQNASFTYEKTTNVARNFMFMIPELAAELRSQKAAQVQAAVDEFNRVEPYWFVSRFDQTWGEAGFHTLYDYHALFQAKARILNESFDDLVKYMDVPAFWRGDLYYIQNLTAALELAGSSGPTPPTAPQNLRVVR